MSDPLPQNEGIQTLPLGHFTSLHTSFRISFHFCRCWSMFSPNAQWQYVCSHVCQLWHLKQQLKHRLGDYGTSLHSTSSWIHTLRDLIQFCRWTGPLSYGAIIHDQYVILAPGTGTISGHKDDRILHKYSEPIRFYRTPPVVLISTHRLECRVNR